MLLILTFLLSPAHAATFKEKCPDIATCAQSVAALTGDKYVFDGDVKGNMQATDNVVLDASNADMLFTNALNANGFARVPLGEPRTYQIMRSRDARDSALPIYEANKGNLGRIPKTWDLVTVRYQSTGGPDIVEQLARNARSLMPANARIIPDGLGGALLLTDAAANITRVLELLKTMDIKPTAEMKKAWKEQAEARLRAAPPPPGAPKAP